MSRPSRAIPASSPASAGSTATAGCCSRRGRCGCSATAPSAVVLVLYLAAAGLDPLAIGIVLTLTLVGDTLISLWLTTNADRLGRRRVLDRRRAADGAGGRRLRAARAGCRCSSSAGDDRRDLSPTGNEVGPFLADRAGGADRDRPRPRAGRRPSPGTTSPATSRPRSGALAAGLAQPGAARRRAGRRRRLPRDRPRLRRHRRSAHGRSGPGGSARRSRPRRAAATTGIAPPARPPRSQGVVAAAVGPVRARRLRRRLRPAEPDGLLVPPAVRASSRRRSARSSSGPTSSPPCRRSSAARIAARIGLINTMVFTHLPSNVLLMLVPLMPTLPLAVACPAARASASARWTCRRASAT